MKVGGRDFNLTKRDVEERMIGADPELIQKHMVDVSGVMFPPKQVLAHVTGWDRTSFTTMEAQRVLTRIGFACAEAPGGRIRQAGQYVLDAVRDSAHETMSDHGQAHHARGFTAAAGIALRQIQNRLDALKEQMKAPGSGLSPADQALYAHLDELKADVEADCDDYWNDTAVDWRPPKPVTKRAIRSARRSHRPDTADS